MARRGEHNPGGGDILIPLPRRRRRVLFHATPCCRALALAGAGRRPRQFLGGQASTAMGTTKSTCKLFDWQAKGTASSSPSFLGRAGSS